MNIHYKNILAALFVLAALPLAAHNVLAAAEPAMAEGDFAKAKTLFFTDVQDVTEQQEKALQVLILLMKT